MKKLKSLQDLFVEELRDIYYAEKQIIAALPKMEKKADSNNLKTAFKKHLKETEVQVERLEEVFEQLEIAAKGKKCEAIEGIIKEAKEIMKESAEPAVMDAALIISAQKVEHYEMASYGSLRTFANILGYKKIASLLQSTLDEETAADKKLTEIAESYVNEEAVIEDNWQAEEEEMTRTKKKSKEFKSL